MHTKPNLWVVDWKGYGLPFTHTFNIVEKMEDAHAVMLTGGADISPSRYGEKEGSHTYTHPEREVAEWAAIIHAREKNIPVIGICRGAQFLCVANGGKLVQDVTGHGRNHNITTIHDGTEKGRKGLDADLPFYMTSLHHQMMRLENTKHTLIGWANNLSRHYLNGDDQEIYDHGLEKEPEIVVFHDTRGLAIQGHPEMLPFHHPTVYYVNELVKDYLL